MELVKRYGLNTTDLLFTLAVALLILAPFLLEAPLLLVPVFILAAASLMLASLGRNIKGRHLLYLLLLFIFLLPPMDIVDALPVFRPEQFFFLLIFPLAIYFRQDRTQLHNQKLVTAFLLFLAYQIFSIFFGALFKSVAVGYKDIAEVIRVAQYLIAAFLISSLELEEKDYRHILLSITGFFVVSAVIGLFQYYSILNLDSLTAPYYSEGRHWSVNIRMYGTFINPNTYGGFLAIGIIFCTGLFLYSKELIKKLGYALCFLILFWALSLTESRTALIALFTGLIVFITCYSYFIKGSVKRALLPLLAFAVVFTLLFLILRSDLIARFSTILTFMEDESWQIRLFAWAVNWEVFLQSWMFGYGPSLHQFSPTVDNDYLLILRRYGVIGFLFYLNLYWVAFRKSLRAAPFKSDHSSLFRIIFLSALSIFLVGNLTNQVFHEMQFMAFWAVLLGLLFNKTTGTAS